MLSTIIQSVLRVINQTYPIGSNLTQLILNSIQPLSVAVVFLGMMVLYFILPNVKIRKIRYIMPGTIFTTLVIGYLSNLFGTYVIHTLSRLIGYQAVRIDYDFHLHLHALVHLPS